MRASHTGARGAAYVEVLVIVGVVVTLGFAAVLALGKGATSKADEQAKCIVSFACNGGHGAPTTSALAAVVGTSVTAGATATATKTTVPLRASPPSKRALADAASSALADAEDRLAALERIDASDDAIDQAEAARDAAYDAWKAAGQAVLDEAYGGSYGTLDRNWIDFENTPSFLGGMAVGTFDGVLSAPGDIADGVGAAWDWVTGNSPPPDPAAEHAAHLAERSAELEQELLRISPGGGSAANYRDGVYDGDVVVSGVVVGEGVVSAIKAAVGAARVAKSVDIIANARRGEKLGEGKFSIGYRHGDVVQKVIKTEIKLADGTMRPLSQAEREMLAKEGTALTNEASEAVGASVIPPLTDLGDGVLQQSYVEGKSLSDLLKSGDMAAYDRAIAARDAAMAKAADAIGMPYGPYSSAVMENGWTVKVDENIANFRFAPDGSLIAWFDPIAIFPP